jgi:hypothetical protein
VRETQGIRKNLIIETAANKLVDKYLEFKEELWLLSQHIIGLISSIETSSKKTNQLKLIKNITKNIEFQQEIGYEDYILLSKYYSQGLIEFITKYNKLLLNEKELKKKN